MMIRLFGLTLVSAVVLLFVQGFQPISQQQRSNNWIESIKSDNIPLVTVKSTSAKTSSSETKSSNNNKKTQVGNNLPPVLQHIADERAEYQINLGRAMDTLKKDMPYILSKSPNFDIYHNEISVIDPSGVQLVGIEKYKSAITFMQTFIRFWFREESCRVQYRMVYDFCRSSIRISWHAVLVHKVLPFGRPLHIDGISYYQLDSDSGKIIEHKIENLIINNRPIIPPYGILSLLQQDALGLRPQGVPAGVLGSKKTEPALLQ